MNKVYLSGVVVENPSFITTEQGTPHLSLHLSVTHKSKLGLKSELYRVNAWNNAAIWGCTNLKRGQQLMIQGYLTQRPRSAEGAGAFDVEVTAEEFFTGTRHAQKRQESAPVCMPIETDAPDTAHACVC